MDVGIEKISSSIPKLKRELRSIALKVFCPKMPEQGWHPEPFLCLSLEMAEMLTLIVNCLSFRGAQEISRVHLCVCTVGHGTWAWETDRVLSPVFHGSLLSF